MICTIRYISKCEIDVRYYPLDEQKCDLKFGSWSQEATKVGAGWQKLRERASGARRKVWTRTKILSPNIRYFVAILRFVAIYAFYKAFIEL